MTARTIGFTPKLRRKLGTVVASAALVGIALTGCGGDSSGDIEAWLVDVGNDFPDTAECVAAEMKSYSVSDFEASFDGDFNASFETELDAAYLLCDTKLGVTTG